MNILYVTSFTAEMFPLTAIHLLRSFLETQSDGTLLVCHEGDCQGLDHLSERIVRYDLANSVFLKEWLTANEDIIPVSLGGKAVACSCGSPDDPWGNHKAGCVFYWFNKNASRWFRKIVALELAISTNHPDAVVWIDCDCLFTKQLPAQVFARLFEGVSVLYHKSPDRAVIESGVIAFKSDPGGFKVLRSLIERFRTGRFRQDLRWDDGYQFQLVINDSVDVITRDLGVRAPAADGMGHVLPSSPLGMYIRHFKGAHSVLRLMI